MRARSPRNRRRHSLRALLDVLESRIALSTFDVATEPALRAAIAAADTNGSGSNTIVVTSSIALGDTAAGPLVIEGSSTAAETLTIAGQVAGTIVGGPRAGTPGSSRWSGRARRA